MLIKSPTEIRVKAQYITAAEVKGLCLALVALFVWNILCCILYCTIVPPTNSGLRPSFQNKVASAIKSFLRIAPERRTEELKKLIKAVNNQDSPLDTRKWNSPDVKQRTRIETLNKRMAEVLLESRRVSHGDETPPSILQLPSQIDHRSLLGAAALQNLYSTGVLNSKTEIAPASSTKLVVQNDKNYLPTNDDFARKAENSDHVQAISRMERKYFLMQELSRLKILEDEQLGIQKLIQQSQQKFLSCGLLEARKSTGFVDSNSDLDTVERQLRNSYIQFSDTPPHPNRPAANFSGKPNFEPGSDNSGITSGLRETDDLAANQTPTLMPENSCLPTIDLADPDALRENCFVPSPPLKRPGMPATPPSSPRDKDLLPASINKTIPGKEIIKPPLPHSPPSILKLNSPLDQQTRDKDNSASLVIPSSPRNECLDINAKSLTNSEIVNISGSGYHGRLELEEISPEKSELLKEPRVVTENFADMHETAAHGIESYSNSDEVSIELNRLDIHIFMFNLITDLSNTDPDDHSKFAANPNISDPSIIQDISKLLDEHHADDLTERWDEIWDTVVAPRMSADDILGIYNRKKRLEDERVRMETPEGLEEYERRRITEQKELERKLNEQRRRAQFIDLEKLVEKDQSLPVCPPPDPRYFSFGKKCASTKASDKNPEPEAGLMLLKVASIQKDSLEAIQQKQEPPTVLAYNHRGVILPEIFGTKNLEISLEQEYISSQKTSSPNITENDIDRAEIPTPRLLTSRASKFSIEPQGSPDIDEECSMNFAKFVSTATRKIGGNTDEIKDSIDEVNLQELLQGLDWTGEVN